MKVVSISRVHAKEVAAVLRELTQMADDGELVSFAFLGETADRQQLDGLVGLYRKDPPRALGHLAVLEQKLGALALRASGWTLSRT